MTGNRPVKESHDREPIIDAERLIKAAQYAQATGDKAKALSVWLDAILHFTDQPKGWAGAAGCLRELGCAESADCLISQARKLFGRCAGIDFTWANMPGAWRDWGAMARRWVSVLQDHSDHADAYPAAALALLQADRLAEARATASTGIKRFPRNPKAYRAYAIIHERIGELIVADQAIQTAVELDQFDVVARRYQVQIAVRREDWTAAAERLKVAKSQFPSDHRIADLESLVKIGSAIEGQPLEQLDVSGAESDDAQKLLSSFESLGGESTGCEFGFVQRHYKLEPLGLLRWASTKPLSLIKLLQCDFKGVGLAQNTRMVLAETEGRWKSFDTGYHIDMVTFLDAATNSVEVALRKVCQRASFLAEKLRNDLRLGDKLFVYKSVSKDLYLAKRLQEAIRSYGPGWLLWVRLSDAANPEGTVTRISDGLIVGHMDRYGASVGEINFELWLEICAQAEAMRSACE
jgi:tetratricopeptide (TPR) repeat protein